MLATETVEGCANTSHYQVTHAANLSPV